MSRRAAASLLLALLAGCSTVKDVGTGVAAVTLLDGASLVGIETMAGGWLMYTILDPAAPNWEIRAMQQQDENTWELRLQHKALHTGGDGEARQVFQRAAKRIAREQALNEYEIVSYQEGVESTRPFARRFAQGEIRLTGTRNLPTGRPAARAPGPGNPAVGLPAPL